MVEMQFSYSFVINGMKFFYLMKSFFSGQILNFICELWSALKLSGFSSFKSNNINYNQMSTL